MQEDCSSSSVVAGAAQRSSAQAGGLSSRESSAAAGAVQFGTGAEKQGIRLDGSSTAAAGSEGGEQQQVSAARIIYRAVLAASSMVCIVGMHLSCWKEAAGCSKPSQLGTALPEWCSATGHWSWSEPLLRLALLCHKAVHCCAASCSWHFR